MTSIFATIRDFSVFQLKWRTQNGLFLLPMLKEQNKRFFSLESEEEHTHTVPLKLRVKNQLPSTTRMPILSHNNNQLVQNSFKRLQLAVTRLQTLNCRRGRSGSDVVCHGKSDDNRMFKCNSDAEEICCPSFLSRSLLSQICCTSSC